jgi:GT2 family glycosyltransferase
MPVHNRVALINRVLEHLAENTTYENVELVTVDDRSDDGGVAVLRRWAATDHFPEMRVIQSTGSGAIDALNTALNAATGEYCIQLDDDVTIETPGWIERMLELMAIDESVGVVTGKVVFDSGHIQCCGVNVVGPWGWHERPTTPSEPMGRRLFLNRVKGRPREGAGGIAERRVAEVDSGIGCCMMYRREDALAAGGYDENYSPVWFDDVDLCTAIRRLGRKAFCLPDVRAVHHFGARRPDGARARMRQLRSEAMRVTAARLPYRVRASIERRYDVDLLAAYTRDQTRRLSHHHAYWREKWGWDALNPDMDEVQRRWGDTEICWATDPERRAAGERIVEAYEAARSAPGVSAG